VIAVRDVRGLSYTEMMAIKPHQDGDTFFPAVEEAISYGGPKDSRLTSAAEFDATGAHVMVLIADAAAMYRRRSYGTCVFLAITALEEIAKAEIQFFRVKFKVNGQKRGRDPLRDHAKKHVIAVRPTTFMGRLPNLLGGERCARLQKEAEEGSLVELREQALYAHFEGRRVMTPAAAISQTRAREILLLALEAATDVLVGWTSETDRIYEPCVAMIEEFS
jgi:AbiV family abortive infection protein